MILCSIFYLFNILIHYSIIKPEKNTNKIINEKIFKHFSLDNGLLFINKSVEDI